MHTSLSNKRADAISIAFLNASNKEDWDNFCLESDDAWFWHTTKWHDYTLEYRPELTPVSHSFLVFAGAEIAAICPLVLETSRGPAGEVRQFSYGGDAAPSPAFSAKLSAKIRKAARRALFEQIDQLAVANRVQRVAFRTTPLAPCFWRSDYPLPNPLLREGFSDISLLSQVIDLSKTKEQLFREIRNDHRNDIKRAEKILSVSIFDNSNITDDHFERYRLLHHKAAGRTTRPRSTFDMMHRWIQEGFAALACASINGEGVGFALINVYKDAAYYSSSANDPAFGELPIGHLLQWRVLNWLKDRGIRCYETGLQQYASLPHALASRKDWNISNFKRGFGGVTVPFFRAEKFYDEEYCRRVLEERAAAYSRTLSNSGLSLTA